MQRHRASGDSVRGFLLASLTMVLWGVLPLALRAVLQYVDPVTLTGVRMAFATLVLGAILAMTGRWPRLGGLSRMGFVLLFVAIAGLASNYIGFVLGLHHTSPASAQVLIQLGPLLLGMGGLVVFGERFARVQWFGVALLVAGLGTFFSSQLVLLGRELDRYLLGVEWIVFAAATWAAYGLAQKQLLLSLPSQAIMLLVYLGCAACFLPFSDLGRVLRLDAEGIGLLLFCSANTLVAYGAFAASLEHWEASRVSAVLALTPLATLSFSALASELVPSYAAPERLSAESWIGAGLVVAGSLVTALGRRSLLRARPAPPAWSLRARGAPCESDIERGGESQGTGTFARWADAGGPDALKPIARRLMLIRALGGRAARGGPMPLIARVTEQTGRFGLLLGAILLDLLVSPIIAASPLGFPGERILAGFVLIAAVVVGWGGRGAIILFALALGGTLAEILVSGVDLRAPVVVTRLVFLAYVFGGIVHRVLSERDVTLDTIAGAACAYVLLGLVFGQVFVLIEIFAPGSFEIPSSFVVGHEGDVRAALTYFSLTTLTTVGYGDIHPSVPGVGALAVTEAIVGQLYLAIMVARLVGLHLAAPRS